MTTRPGKRTSTKPIDAPQQLLGRVLDGRYRLEDVLNVGGMGIIFRAYQLATDRFVAVKVLRPTLASDVDMSARFQQEIATMSALSHPNIVALFDSGQDVAGLHYLVMELVEGKTLATCLEAHELSLVELVEVFAQVCAALDAAHAHDIIHRDMKFENIMLQRLGARLHVKVLDFGVAKSLTQDTNITRSGEVPGTPGIIAPELADAVAPSPQSDLYSLGVLLFTALVGEPPFAGNNEFELMRAHQQEEIPRIDERVPPEVPERLIEIVYELMQKDPARRPADAGTVEQWFSTLARKLAETTPNHRYFPLSEDVPADRRKVATPPATDRSQSIIAAATPREEHPPSVAPTTIIGMLIIALIVTVAALLYTAFRLHFTK